MFSDILALYSGQARQQVDEYLNGDRTNFSVQMPLSGTDFQVKAWQAMMAIPYGQTRTYKQIADQIGHPKAVRAVGAACGKNKWPIIVPCHRIVGANGLGGFAFGLEAKKALLELESRMKSTSREA